MSDSGTVPLDSGLRPATLGPRIPLPGSVSRWAGHCQDPTRWWILPAVTLHLRSLGCTVHPSGEQVLTGSFHSATSTQEAAVLPGLSSLQVLASHGQACGWTNSTGR